MSLLKAAIGARLVLCTGERCLPFDVEFVYREGRIVDRADLGKESSGRLKFSRSGRCIESWIREDVRLVMRGGQLMAWPIAPVQSEV